MNSAFFTQKFPTLLGVGQNVVKSAEPKHFSTLFCRIELGKVKGSGEKIFILTSTLDSEPSLDMPPG